MANVSFYIGDSAPGTSGLTTGGLYCNKNNGGIYYATSATAKSELASKVSFSRSLTSGTKIGTISINGTTTDLYCQTNTDTKCSYASSTTNSEYPLLMKSSTSTTTTAGTPYFNTGITVNPSTKKITASLFKGYLVPTYVGTDGTTLSAGFYTITGTTSGGGVVTHVLHSSSFYYDGSSQCYVANGSQALCNISQGTGKVTAASGVSSLKLYAWGA